MKKSIIIAGFFLTTFVANAQVKVNRIDPTNWFVGMKDASLQLMVYGNHLHGTQVSTNYEGVRIDSVVNMPNEHYLLAYLNVKDAQPGIMTLKFTNRKKSQKVKYLLKQREMSGDKRMGFTNADVLYMLMPDRFANGNTQNDQIKGMNKYVCDRTQPSLRHGGDLEGIRKHLNYFTDLGVTALWFTPVLENNSPDTNGFSTYHGYATTDYYKVDPRFGTNAEYRQLIDQAHQKGLKVVMDMIFNHCGLEHPWIKELPSDDWFNYPEWLKEGMTSGRDEKTGMPNGSKVNSKYLQTSYKLTPVLDPYASKIDMKETVDGWFVPSMPDLNQRNPHVIKYLIQNSEWWIETAGINGIRMDTYPYADRKAMAHWMKVLNEEYPNFNVVGETWNTEPAYTAAWQKDSKLSTINSNLKTVMDFSFFEKINKAKNEETDAWWNGLNKVYNSFAEDYLYEDPKAVMAFIENHDTDRYLGNGQNVASLKQALSLLLTINRIPQLYYGTEVLMNGTKQKSDGNVRQDFPGGFPGDAHSAFTVEGRTKAQNETFNWLSKLLHWRQGNEIISKGKQIQFIPHNGVYVIARQYKGKTVLTILNGTSKSAKMEVARYAEVIGKQATAQDVITGENIDLSKDIQLSPRQSLIIEL